jgi:hypothetical protein
MTIATGPKVAQTGGPKSQPRVPRVYYQSRFSITGKQCVNPKHRSG